MALQNLSLDTRRAIERYASIYNFDPELIASVVEAESGGNPNARSEVGATGLMQTFGQAPISDAMRTGLLKKQPDLSTVDGQIQAGTAYLAYLRDYEKAPSLEHLLMMYNGGPKMKGAQPTGTAEQLKQYVAQRYGYDFDGVQNANYRDSILKSYQKAGGDLTNYTFKPIAQQGTAVQAPSDSSGGLQNTTAADTGTGIDSAVLSNQARNTSNAQTTSTAATDDGTTRMNVSNLQDLGNTEAAEVATYFETAEQSLQENIAFQRESVADFDRNVDNLPENPDFQSILSGAIQELEGYSARNRQLVNDAYDQLAARDSERRAITQNLSERIDYDPTDPDSLLQGVLQDQVRLQRRLRATQEMRQRVGDAAPGTAGYFRRLIFGNEYARGAADLTQMSQQNQTVFNNTMNTLRAQIQLAEEANLSDPSLITGRLQADLQLNEADARIAEQRELLPLKVFEQEAQQAEREFARLRERRQAQQELVQTELKQTDVQLQKQRAMEQARDRPINRAQAVASLEATELRIQQAKNDADLNAILRDQEVANAKLKQQITSAEGKQRLAELERDEARLNDPQYMKQLNEAETLALKQRIATARVDIAKAEEVQRTGAVSTSVAQTNLANQQEISERNKQELLRKRRSYAWNEILGNQNADGTDAPVPNMRDEDLLALELMANGKAADSNPVTSVQRLTKLNAFKPRGGSDIERQILSGTAQAVMRAVQNHPDFNDPRRVELMTNEDFKNKVGDLVNRETAVTNSATGSTNINGVLPATLLVEYAPDARTKAFLNEQGEAFDQALSYQEKLTVASNFAKTQGLTNLTDRANFVAGVFSTAVAANNDLRGYSIMGLPRQQGMRVVQDRSPFLIGMFAEDTKVDLTSAPQLQRYLISLEIDDRARTTFDSRTPPIPQDGINVAP